MPDPPADLLHPRPQHVPPGTGTVGMALFLVALAGLFGSSIVGYLIIRLSATNAPPMNTIDLPWGLWVSTVTIMASSLTIHWSLQAVRIERQTPFRRWLSVTLVLAVLFLLVQTPCLVALLHDHLPKVEAFRQAWQEARAAGQFRAAVPMSIDGFIFALILLHAAHVIGGVVPLAVVTVRAHADRYDHESHNAVKYMAMYWHFLDAVWIIMFAVFLLTM